MTWRQLNSIYQAVEKEQYDDAYADLGKMLDRAGSDAYLRAILSQALAQVEWARGNLSPAIAYLETALELDALPDSAHYALLYQVAQLYYMEGRLDLALQRLDLWFCAVPSEQINSAPWELKAAIFAQQLNYASALVAIEAAIELDKNPPESWYQMKLAAHLELEQFSRAAETLELLIARWPQRKAYWTQLSQMHYKLKQDQLALAVQALAHRRGLLDQQSDITYLASLYGNLQLPFKAAEVLEQGIVDGIVEPSSDHWILVADSWYAAGELERALAAYRAAGDGLTDLRRSYLLVDLERWPAALEALNQALLQGGLDDRRTGEAYLLRGMARFNLGDLDGAGEDWERAGRFEKSREAARQWRSYLQEERQRRAS